MEREFRAEHVVLRGVFEHRRRSEYVREGEVERVQGANECERGAAIHGGKVHRGSRLVGVNGFPILSGPINVCKF